MKKEILSEVNEIKKMMGLVVEQEELDYKYCLGSIPRFFLKKTTGMKNRDYGGGDLGFWNDNKMPKITDLEAKERFIEYVKSVYQDDNTMVWSEDCGEAPSWEELLPHINRIYFDSVLTLTRGGKEEVTIEDVPQLITHFSEVINREEFEDEFMWAYNVIDSVVDAINKYQNLTDREYDTLYNKIKDEYGPELLGL